MITALAWLPLRVSLTLVALLTVVILPWALLTMRRSAMPAAMALAMVGMMWRGEAWKTVYLREQAQLFQCLQQLPKTAFFDPSTLPLRDEVRFVLGFGEVQSLDVRAPAVALTGVPLNTFGPRGADYKALLVLRDSDHAADVALSSLSRTATFHLPLQNLREENDYSRSGIKSEPESNYHTNAGPTPMRRCWVVIRY